MLPGMAANSQFWHGKTHSGSETAAGDRAAVRVQRVEGLLPEHGQAARNRYFAQRQHPGEIGGVPAEGGIAWSS